MVLSTVNFLHFTLFKLTATKTNSINTKNTVFTVKNYKTQGQKREMFSCDIQDK